MTEPVPIVVEYDPTWPEAFEVLAGVLSAAVGGLAAAIHHVGSTSIPGMLAKPVLDIDIELDPAASVAEASLALAPLGYVFAGDQGIPDRYAYKRASEAVPYTQSRSLWPTHHLYVCPSGSVELSRHLLFRDKLRASPELRQAYWAVKLAALNLAQGDRAIYVAEKARLGDAFFRHVLEA